MTQVCANCGSEIKQLPSGKLQCTGCRVIIRSFNSALAPSEARVWQMAAELRLRANQEKARAT